MVTQQGKGRTGMEIGAMLAAMVFMLSLSFQAGIQYGETQNLKIASTANRESINHIEERSQALDARMSRVEQLLSDIKDTLQARGYKQ